MSTALPSTLPVGIVLITHAPLAQALLACVQHVYGTPPPYLYALDIPAKQDIQTSLTQAQNIIQKANQGNGVIILTDLYGATPCNIAAQCYQAGHVEIITSVSLPMLIRAVQYSPQGFEQTLHKTLHAVHDCTRHFQPNQE